MHEFTTHHLHHLVIHKSFSQKESRHSKMYFKVNDKHARLIY
jgi:hypothetical protein